MGSRRRVAGADQNQARLFDLGPEGSAEPVPGRRVFTEPSPYDLRMGAQRLDEYLHAVGSNGPVRLATALRELDWSGFESAYAGAGAPPYAPRLMCGLVMYGLGKGVSSLRDLEQMARTDLGCMWVCSGIQPDHSNIGRFILRHREEFEGEFFEQTAKLALNATNSGTANLSGDGTMVQAAASRYQTLKREALDRKLGAARSERTSSDDDDDSSGRLKRYEAADAELSKREEARAKQHKSIDGLRVSVSEPEAPIQPLKNKSFAPSYKPSVLANAKRVIVGIAVDTTSETTPLVTMLEQAERIGNGVEMLRLDAGYHCTSVIEMALERDINLLCTPGSEVSKKTKGIPKSEFRYDEDKDVYICPEQKQLVPKSRNTAAGYVQYRGTACQECPRRMECAPKAKRGRTVKRYPVDEAKEALREVMSHPRAQADLRQRKATVEPVFGYLACCMGLRRFRRRGLNAVKTEFSLYAAAYNLTRVVGARAALLARMLHLALWRLLVQDPSFRPAVA